VKNLINVAVTGADGQLGLALRNVSKSDSAINYYFFNATALNITDNNSIETVFKKRHYDYCINCAAYTNVEKAETEPKRAYEVNARGVEILSQICKAYKVILIHISTDYVFDGKNARPYYEDDNPNPINVYGASKLAGERHILNTLKNYYIIRTSWLYAPYGHNFYTFIREKLTKDNPINVVNTQEGSPTNAFDLARALRHMVSNDRKNYGIYHFSNKDVTNWYIFAKRIIELVDPSRLQQLAPIKFMMLKAKRPKYSKLNVSKFEREFKYIIPTWNESLEDIIKAE